jgi:hypothetical protein
LGGNGRREEGGPEWQAFALEMAAVQPR